MQGMRREQINTEEQRSFLRTRRYCTSAETDMFAGRTAGLLSLGSQVRVHRGAPSHSRLNAFGSLLQNGG